MSKKLTDISTAQKFEHPGDIADYLYDEFDFHTVVERDSDNEKEAFTRFGGNWDVFCFASVRVADELVQAVDDGVFPCWQVANTHHESGEKSKKVWLVLIKENK